MEIRERAVRLVLEHQGEYSSQWAAISSIATKCGLTPETLRKWVRRIDAEEFPANSPPKGTLRSLSDSSRWRRQR